MKLLSIFAMFPEKGNAFTRHIEMCWCSLTATLIHSEHGLRVIQSGYSGRPTNRCVGHGVSSVPVARVEIE